MDQKLPQQNHESSHCTEECEDAMLHSFAPQANCGSNDLKLPTKLALETYH